MIQKKPPDAAAEKGSFLTLVVSTITTVCLFISLLGLGLFVCCAPNTTNMLSSSTSVRQNTPFTQQQMVDLAQATRDYTVGSHDKDLLYHKIFETNKAAQEDEASPYPGEPKLPIGNQPSTDEIIASFSTASDRFVLTEEAVSHLDDVYSVVSSALTAILVVAILALLGCVFVGIKAGRQKLGFTLMLAGASVIASFILLGLWAAIDFNSLFTYIHSLFFTEGTWVFSADSLLIRMYPEQFWIGMGVVWLVSTISASLLCLILGLIIKGRRKQRI